MSQWQDPNYESRRMSDAYDHGRGVTAAQLETINAMIDERGLDFPTVRGLVKEITGFSGHPDTLSNHEASRFITRLAAFPKVTVTAE